MEETFCLENCRSLVLNNWDLKFGGKQLRYAIDVIFFLVQKFFTKFSKLWTSLKKKKIVNSYTRDTR